MRLMIVDDHEVVREGLSATLGADPRDVLVASVSTGAAALALAGQMAPDVALVDLRLPDMSGEDLCRELVAASPSLSVVILSTYLSEETVRGALQAGAVGYVTKAAGLPRLREVLDELRQGLGAPPHSLTAPQIVQRLEALVAEREGARRATPQQERVLALAAEGMTNRAVGERLRISESTVRFHVQKLKELTGARTRTELVAKAIRLGMIPPPATRPIGGRE
jgi:DNA-binding NarL/FixJ family response regulator